MNDKMFSFMEKVVSLSTSEGRFIVSELPCADDDLRLLMDAERRKWVIIKSYDSRITPAGMKAFLDEKHRRDDESDNRGKPSQNKPLVILGKVAIWLAGAVVTALIAQAVSVLLQ